MTCVRQPSCDLLAVESDPVEAAGPTNPAGFVMDETEGILFALALAVEQRDQQTGGHCQRLASIAVAMGIGMGLGRSLVVSLYRGGYLHDIGKVGIPDSILFKPGKLTTDEWVAMRSHTTRGEEICRHMKSLEPVLPIVRHHHERWDGSGYPDGLRGEQIPLLARVLQIADIYDALSSPRPYKPAFTPEHALAVIQEETDRGWRDPEIVKAFLRLHKNVLSKMPHYSIQEDGIEGMRTSLANLQRILASELQPAILS